MRRHTAQSLDRVIWFFAVLISMAWLVEVLGTDSSIVTRFFVPAGLIALLMTWILQRRFHRPSDPQNRQIRIVIVGAGPAGLSAAYFLKLHGYREVLVLEKHGHVGGLCRTITEDYHSFDLGANYVTPAYKETLALADDVGAELYVERPITTVNLREDPPEFADPWKRVTQGVSAWEFIRLCLRYLWLRLRLSRIIDPPGHAHIHNHPELCVPFFDWLQKHRLEPLQTLFEAPITIMGYGYLHEIPAPYALKYMSPRTFIALALKAFPLTKRWYPWPKRFVLGFQRLWEVVSWELNVRHDVEIREITRTNNNGKVSVRLIHREQMLNQTESHEDEFEFDKLILACPLTDDVLRILTDRTEEELALFSQIQRESYCLTSFTTRNVAMDSPIAACLPLPEIGMPFAITKQTDESNLFQFYSRILPEWEQLAAEVPVDESPYADHSLSDAQRKELTDPVRAQVVGRVRDVVRRLGGEVDEAEWHTYDRWSYFQHVSAKAMRDGFYQRLEAIQGQRNTYYVGAIMNFELVETSIAYSKHLVEKHFPRRRSPPNRPV
jgi:hypothetical protein